MGEKNLNSPFFHWRKFVKCTLCIFALEVVCRTYLPLALEKNVSWKVYIAAVLLFFSSSRVIVEIGQKQHSCLLHKGRLWLLGLVAENAWNNVPRRTRMSFFYKILSIYFFTVMCNAVWIYPEWEHPYWALETCDPICTRPESSQINVFTQQLFTMSDACWWGHAGWMQSPRPNEAV